MNRQRILEKRKPKDSSGRPSLLNLIGQNCPAITGESKNSLFCEKTLSHNVQGNGLLCLICTKCSCYRAKALVASRPSRTPGIFFLKNKVYKFSMNKLDKIFSNLKEIPKKPTPIKKKKHIRKSNSLWVICGDKKAYCRSTWEANYFRYLYHLKNNGHIYDFNHEPERFYFDKIKTGTTSYLPDFEVIENTGEVVYHEVKGFMCKVSKIKIKRFLNYYPRKKLIIISSQEYKQIKENFSRIIVGWI